MHHSCIELRLNWPKQRETPVIHSGQNQNHHEQLCRLIKQSPIGKEQPTNQPTNNHPRTLLEAYKRLSSRECEVLVKIEKGKSCQQIADELFLSKKTVENHITNIGKRLNLNGRGRLRKWLKSQR